MSDWLVYYGEDEAVFRKPYSRRLLSVILLVIMTCVLGFATVIAYKGSAAQRDYLPLNFMALFVVFLILSLGAGPNEMRFIFVEDVIKAKWDYFFSLGHEPEIFPRYLISPFGIRPISQELLLSGRIRNVFGGRLLTAKLMMMQKLWRKGLALASACQAMQATREVLKSQYGKQSRVNYFHEYSLHYHS